LPIFKTAAIHYIRQTPSGFAIRSPWALPTTPSIDGFVVASRRSPDYDEGAGKARTNRGPFMQAKLIVVAGKASKGTFSLTLPAVVGRGQDVGLSIGHRTTSRRHAELFEKAGLLMVRDLGSLNGTFIDGKRIKEAPLPPDAEFTVGPLTFRVQYEYDGDRTKLPPQVFFEETSGGTAATETFTDLPDFEAIEEQPAQKATPAKKLPLAQNALPAKRIAAKQEEAPAKAKEDAPIAAIDPFEDLLNELQ
jgi:pSer/pThr/pTyr-binding forkhead associated (FHA) protein